MSIFYGVLMSLVTSGAVSAGGDENPLPRRARDLFEEGSCAWTEHYGDMGILEAVAKIYKKDYNHHRWYKLDTWRARLQACLDKKRE